MEIIKKIDRKMFEKIERGEKTFEVRIEDDCKFNEGEIVILKEVIDGKFSGRELRKKIGFILRTKECDYWNKKDIDKFGFTVLGLRNCE